MNVIARFDRTIADRKAVWDSYSAKADADPVGFFSSKKNRRNIPVWSEADRQFCALAEGAGNIRNYEERPDLLMISDCGHTIPFVVDFRLTLRSSILADERTILIGFAVCADENKDEKRIIARAQRQCALRGENLVHFPRAEFSKRYVPDAHRHESCQPVISWDQFMSQERVIGNEQGAPDERNGQAFAHRQRRPVTILMRR